MPYTSAPRTVMTVMTVNIQRNPDVLLNARNETDLKTAGIMAVIKLRT